MQIIVILCLIVLIVNKIYMNHMIKKHQNEWNEIKKNLNEDELLYEYLKYIRNCGGYFPRR